MAGEMHATDDKGAIVNDDYDELENALNPEGKPIPGNELTGEPEDKSGGEDDKDKGGAGDDKDKGKEAGGEGGDKDKPAGDKDKGGEAGTGEPGGEEDKPTGEEDATPAAGAPTSQRERELLAQQRTMRRQMAIMQAQINRLNKKKDTPAPKDDDLDDDDEPGDKTPKETPEELSEVEELQTELDQVGAARGQALDDMLATMSLTPEYKDVEEVCTQDRFQDIFEAAAADLVEKEGGDPIAAQIAIELNVWKKPNPYKYMYNLIKKFHPDFREAKPAGEGDDKDKDKDKDKPSGEEDPSKDKGKKKPADAPLSALDLSRGGGGKNQGEWTAEKIDNLPEHELDKVPPDIYEAYLRGDLDK